MGKELVDIPLVDIFVDEQFNCRGKFLASTVIGLANDIKEQGGLIQPIVVTTMEGTHKYKLIAGFRRFVAHKKILKWETIESIIRPDLSEKDAILINLNENIQREELNILQEAKVIRKLILMDLGESLIAERLGKARSWVKTRTKLLELPPLIQQECALKMIKQSQISELHTYLSFSKEQCFNAAKEMKTANLNRRQYAPKGKFGRENKKRQRKKGEILMMIDHIMAYFEPGLYTRCLAWAAGEISDKELFKDLKEHSIECSFDLKDTVGEYYKP